MLKYKCPCCRFICSQFYRASQKEICHTRKRAKQKMRSGINQHLRNKCKIHGDITHIRLILNSVGQKGQLLLDKWALKSIHTLCALDKIKEQEVKK